MNYSLELRNETFSDWNNYLMLNNLGNIFNTLEYAQYADKWLNWKPIFCRVLDPSGKILMQNVIFQYISNSDKIPRFLRGTIRKLRNAIRWNYGPVTCSQEAASFFLSEIQKKYRRIYGTTHPLSDLQYPFKKNIWCTFLIELNKTEDEIFGKISKHNGQKNIQRSIERDVVVEEITESTLQDYFYLLQNYRTSMKFEVTKNEEFVD